jgi:hypothetical protein
MATMVSLRRRLNHPSDDDRARQFFSHTLQYLTATSGRQVEIENWMITSYEVEFGPQIGSGGLYVLHLLWSAGHLATNYGLKIAAKYSWELGMRLKLP